MASRRASSPPTPEPPSLPLPLRVKRLREFQNRLREAQKQGRISNQERDRLRFAGENALSAALGKNDPNIDRILGASTHRVTLDLSGDNPPTDWEALHAIDAGHQAALLDELIVPLEEELAATRDSPEHQHKPDAVPIRNPKKVFIIYGRNDNALAAVEIFLKSLGLQPWPFNEVSAEAGPNASVLEIVRKGVGEAQAVIALCTPDEHSALHPGLRTGRERSADTEPTGVVRRWQPRQNVLIELGLALAVNPGTIIVNLGPTEIGTDVSGIHQVRMTNSVEQRKLLKGKLQSANCKIEETTGWETPRTGGDFERCLDYGFDVSDPFVPTTTATASHTHSSPANAPPAPTATALASLLAAQFVHPVVHRSARALSFRLRISSKSTTAVRVRLWRVKGIRIDGVDYPPTDRFDDAVVEVGPLADKELPAEITIALRDEHCNQPQLSISGHLQLDLGMEPPPLSLPLEECQCRMAN